MADIAYDAVSGGNNVNSLTLTFAHTVAVQDNQILIVGVARSGNLASLDDVSGVTYGGQSLTKLTSQRCGQDGRYVELYYLIDPPTGNNNVVITVEDTDANTGTAGVAASYYGAKQSGFPDSLAKNEGSSVTPRSLPTTTVADNCWLIGLFHDGNGGSGGTPLTAGANTTLRRLETFRTTFGLGLFDSNGAKTPAGAYSLNVNNPSDNDGWIVVSLAPVEDLYVPRHGFVNHQNPGIV